MMRKISLGLVCFAALATLSAPASAATTINFSTSSGSAQSGTAGNARTFSAGTGSGAVNVRATGWALDPSNLSVAASFLGRYSGGLGVTNPNEGNGSNNNHVVDNVVRQDFIVLQFDKNVKLISATFSPFGVNGSSVIDTDATIGVGAGTTPWNAPLAIANKAALDAMLPTQYSSNSTSTSTNTRNINLSNYVGKIWMIAASMNNTDNKQDGFKLKDIKIETVTAVPEPASWAMMIAGFGLAGTAMRRRAAKVSVTYA
jgi:hypothetical protein